MADAQLETMYLCTKFEQHVVHICYWIFLTTLICNARAVPTVSLPISSQLPPIAQTNINFNFTFSASTFSSRTGVLAYGLSDSPPWLLLDGSSRRLHGIPSDHDQGTVSFAIIATDNSGSTTLPVNLIVTDEALPQADADVTQQLSLMGNFRWPDSLLLYPDSTFNLSFDKTIFTQTSSDTRYAVIGDDNTPLPLWVNFDPENLVFFGVTPVFTSLEELPQTVGIRLVASKQLGFSQASVSFKLVIESHEVVFTQPQFIVDVEPSRELEFDTASHLIRDNNPVSSGMISQITGNFTHWLGIDNETLLLSGTAPSVVGNTTIVLAAADEFGNTATTLLSIRVSTALNDSHLHDDHLPPLAIYVGKPFNYSLRQPDATWLNISATTDPDVPVTWVHFDNQTHEIFGIVPVNETPKDVVVNLTALSNTSITNEVLTLEIKGISEGGRVPWLGIPGTPPPGSSMPALPTSSTPSSSRDAAQNDTRKGKIISTTVCSIAALLLCLLIACIIKKRKQRSVKARKSDDQSGPEAVASLGRMALSLQHHRFYPRVDVRRLPLVIKSTHHRLTTSARRGWEAAREREPISPQRIRPPRPPSDAPRVGRIILERDPSPLCSFEDEENFQTTGVPELPFVSQLSGSNESQAMDSCSNAISSEANQPASRQSQTQPDDAETQVPSHANAKTGGGSYKLNGCEAIGTSRFTNSRRLSKRSTSASILDSCSEKLNSIPETPENISAPSKTTVIQRRQSQNFGVGEHAAHTASTSTTADTGIREEPRLNRITLPRQRSRHSIRGNQKFRLATGSISKRNSWGDPSPLQLHLKQRRKLPTTARFSHFNSSRRFSYLSQRHEVDSSFNEHISDDSDVTDKENYEPENFAQHERRRSRPAVIRLGLQMQGKANSCMSPESAKSRSSVTSSEPSMSAIEREIDDDCLNMAAFGRHFGGQGGDRLHRLSALRESQGNGDRESGVLLVQNAQAMKALERSEGVQNSSIKGEIDKCEGSSSHGSKYEDNADLDRAKKDLSFKVFV